MSAFFVSLLDSSTEWATSTSAVNVYERDGHPATAVDLVFGSNSQLWALAEVASDDAGEKFARSTSGPGKRS